MPARRYAPADLGGDTMQQQQPLRWRLVGFLYVASFILLTLFAAIRVPLGVVVAAALLAGTSLVLNRRLRRHPPATPRERFWRFMVPVTMVVVGAGLAFLPLLEFADGVGFFGVCLLFLGVGQLLTLWRSSSCGAIVRGLVVLFLCAAAFAAGLAGLSGGASQWAALLLAEGILASPIGLSLLSEDVLGRFVVGSSWRRRLIISATGAVLAVGGFVWLVTGASIPIGSGLAFGVVLALLVAAIASDTPADILIVVAVVAVGWATNPRSVPLTEPAQPDTNETVLVALGDSYMSGEGATQFYEGTNHKKENECRRAPSAYATKVVLENSTAVPDDLAFIACSGAVAAHIYERVQHPGEPIGGPVRVVNGVSTRGLPQLDHLDWLTRQKNVNVTAEVILVSIGGNDALFGEIGRTCLLPGDCSEVGGRWLENLANVAPAVDRAYQEIRDHVGMATPVVVVPYPVPLNETGCPGSVFEPNEHKFLARFVGELNRVLERAATDAGLHYLNEMRTVLDQHDLRLCDVPAGDAGINFFGLNPVDGLIEQRVNPTNWLHNSLHPNHRGHAVMVGTLKDWLEDRPDLPVPREPRREQGLTRIATIEQLMEDPDFRHCGSLTNRPAHCGRTADDWAAGQVADVARRHLAPLLALVVGAWLVSLVAIAWWRRRSAP